MKTDEYGLFKPLMKSKKLFGWNFFPNLKTHDLETNYIKKNNNKNLGEIKLNISTPYSIYVNVIMLFKNIKL